MKFSKNFIRGYYGMRKDFKVGYFLVDNKLKRIRCVIYDEKSRIKEMGLLADGTGFGVVTENANFVHKTKYCKCDIKYYEGMDIPEKYESEEFNYIFKGEKISDNEYVFPFESVTTKKIK